MQLLTTCWLMPNQSLSSISWMCCPMVWNICVGQLSCLCCPRISCSPSCWQTIENWKVLGLGLNSGTPRTSLFNIVLLLIPKHSTIPATRKKSNSVWAKPRTNAYGIVILSWKYTMKPETDVMISLKILLWMFLFHLNFFVFTMQHKCLCYRGHRGYAIILRHGLQLLHQRNVTYDVPKLLLQIRPQRKKIHLVREKKIYVRAYLKKKKWNFKRKASEKGPFVKQRAAWVVQCGIWSKT